MNQYKWLLLSFIAFLFFLGLGVALDCNIGGVHDWRGYKAAFLGVFLALGIASSIITFLFQTLKISQTPGSKIGGILFVFILIFVGLVMAIHFSKQYCH